MKAPRAVAALAATALVTLLASGCQTTQALSAKIGRQLGRQSAVAGTVGIGAASREVRILRAVLVPGSPAAVALELRNERSHALVGVPVLVDVRDAKGASVYSNDTKGIDSSLQQLALLAPRATAWWVDNEVLASGGVPSTLTARVGAAMASAAAARPLLAAHGVSASASFPGPHVDATLVNSSAVAASRVAVYAVALRNGHVIGAGRGIAAAVAAHTSAPVEVAMTGAVSGATVSLTLAPGR